MQHKKIFIAANQGVGLSYQGQYEKLIVARVAARRFEGRLIEILYIEKMDIAADQSNKFAAGSAIQIGVDRGRIFYAPAPALTQPMSGCWRKHRNFQKPVAGLDKAQSRCEGRRLPAYWYQKPRARSSGFMHHPVYILVGQPGGRC